MLAFSILLFGDYMNALLGLPSPYNHIKTAAFCGGAKLVCNVHVAKMIERSKDAVEDISTLFPFSSALLRLRLQLLPSKVEGYQVELRLNSSRTAVRLVLIKLPSYLKRSNALFPAQREIEIVQEP